MWQVEKPFSNLIHALLERRPKSVNNLKNVKADTFAATTVDPTATAKPDTECHLHQT